MAIPRQKIQYPSINLNKLLFGSVGDIELNIENLIKNKLNLKNSNILLNSSARDSIYFVLRCIRKQIKKNKVLISAFNFSLMSRIIESGGFEPVFVDVNPRTLNISKKDLLKKIDDDCGIIIITPMLGNPVEKDIYTELKKKKILIIEDCAHTFNSEHYISGNTKNKSIKTGNFGDIAILSFSISKPLSSIYGGAIVLKNINLNYIAEELNTIKNKLDRVSIFKELKFYLKNLVAYILFTNFIFNVFTWWLIKISFIIKKPFDFVDIMSRDDPKYFPKKIKLLNKLSLIILEKNIEKNDDRNHILFKIQERYDDYLKKVIKRGSSNSINYLYSVLVKNRKKAKETLMKNNIDIKMGYCVDISNGECMAACNLEKHLIYMPYYPFLETKSIKTITKVLLDNKLVMLLK